MRQRNPKTVVHRTMRARLIIVALAAFGAALAVPGPAFAATSGATWTISNPSEDRVKAAITKALKSRRISRRL